MRTPIVTPRAAVRPAASLVCRLLGGAIAATAVALLSGCGTPNQVEKPSPTTSAPAAEAVADTEDDAKGQMLPIYEDATTPEAIAGRTQMQKVTLLETLSANINGSLKLPFDIPLVGKQCDEANDYWERDDKKMILCYEDVNESLTIFNDDPDPGATAANVAMASFYHELGHMAIDLYDLPATGREADDADQMAAYWLLGPYDDGKTDPDLAQAIKDQAREYQIYANEGGDPDDDTYADVHTPNKARMYNLECWQYGSDPDGNQDMITDGLLPQDRADDCNYEYNQLMRSWGTLLDPHMK